MKNDFEIPQAMSSRTTFKRKFSLWEMYRALVLLPRAVATMVGNRRNQAVAADLVKRLQLAVTEVNGCPACSYQHAKMALRQGMSGEEISSFLSGGDQFIKPEEAKAILFAQHFADSRGFPKQYACDALIKEYGARSAEVMLAVVQVMIAGNMYGIAYGAFRSRLAGKPFKGSSLLYELQMLILGVLVLPIAVVHGFLRGSIGLSNCRFDHDKAQQETALDSE